MSPTLPLARQAFVEAIGRGANGQEVPRLVAVLDELLRWSAARAERLAFRPSERGGQVLSFERVGRGPRSQSVFWSARVTAAEGPKLEIFPWAKGSRAAEERANVMRTLNAHSRHVLVDGDRLRIAFSALKNADARAAVLALMDEMLADEPAQPAPARAVEADADAQAR